MQDTPVATRKEDTYIHFSVDIEIQRHVEKLPKGNDCHRPFAIYSWFSGGSVLFLGSSPGSSVDIEIQSHDGRNGWYEKFCVSGVIMIQIMI